MAEKDGLAPIRRAQIARTNRIGKFVAWSSALSIPTLGAVEYLGIELLIRFGIRANQETLALLFVVLIVWSILALIGLGMGLSICSSARKQLRELESGL